MTLHSQWCQGGQVVSLSQSGIQPLQLQGYDQQPQFKQNTLMEEPWMMTQWPNHVFCFLLAVMMVNVQKATTYFLQ